MAFRKIEAGLVHADVDQFIGKIGTIFYDNSLGDFRISDGQTPGGIALSFGGGEGGTYTLPTATTSVKGGVKIDGSTIVIANQVISVGTVPYSSLSGTPTIPTNNNQLSNGAAYITSSALSTYALSSSVPTNNNQLSNGAGYITSSSLTGLATETYVTTRGYITSAALSTYALTSSVPTDINQLTDVSGLLGGGGGGGGTTYITNTVENPYSFSIAGDDSTLREIVSGESIKITGAGGITVTTDAEGNLTVTGIPVSLAGYATESYVTSRGYITGLSYNDLTDKPNLAGTYTFNVAADDSTMREISSEETVKFVGAGGITTASDEDGNITITGPSLTGLATESYVTSRGYITGLSYNDLTDKPNLAGTYSWSIAADDSTQVEISAGNLVKIVGTNGITTTSTADGLITISGVTQDRLTSNARSAVLNSNGTFSLPTMTAAPTSPQAGQMALANGTSWDPITQGNGAPYMVIYTGSAWIGMGGGGGGVTVDQVYSIVLEMT